MCLLCFCYCLGILNKFELMTLIFEIFVVYVIFEISLWISCLIMVDMFGCMFGLSWYLC